MSSRITKLVTPPQTFIFDSDLREKLLFEDKDFTYSKRYFWAFQTLGTMNDSIKALVDSYEDTFTDDVWDGTNKTIWPMVEGSSARTLYYKKKMQQLKRRFEEEMKNFKDLMNENDGRRREIRSLRDQLFSGTSVLESRKSVDLASIAIEQNTNIKGEEAWYPQRLRCEQSLTRISLDTGQHLFLATDIRYGMFFYACLIHEEVYLTD